MISRCRYARQWRLSPLRGSISQRRRGRRVRRDHGRYYRMYCNDPDWLCPWRGRRRRSGWRRGRHSRRREHPAAGLLLPVGAAAAEGRLPLKTKERPPSGRPLLPPVALHHELLTIQRLPIRSRLGSMRLYSSPAAARSSAELPGDHPDEALHLLSGGACLLVSFRPVRCCFE